MFECWAMINGEWLRGWDCGAVDSNIAFRAECDIETVYYVAEEGLCYDAFPSGMCEECLMIGYHKFTCEKGCVEITK